MRTVFEQFQVQSLFEIRSNRQDKALLLSCFLSKNPVPLSPIMDSIVLC